MLKINPFSQQKPCIAMLLLTWLLEKISFGESFLEASLKLN